MKVRLCLVLLLWALPPILAAQDQGESKFEIYGFAMMDAGYDFKQVHPDWFDVVRPTKLPSLRTNSAPMAIPTSVSGRRASASSPKSRLIWAR